MACFLAWWIPGSGVPLWSGSLPCLQFGLWPIIYKRLSLKLGPEAA